MPYSPFVMRPGSPTGLASWRMETIQDHSKKSAQGHGAAGLLSWASDQRPGQGYAKGEIRVLTPEVSTRPLTSGRYSLGSFRTSCFSFFKKNFFYWSIYNIVLISGVQQSDSYIYVCIYIYFFLFFSIMIYHRILNIILCAIHKQDLVAYPFCI